MTLVRVDPLHAQRPLHGVAASRAIEAAAQAALPAHTLMQRAGLAVARLALAVAPHAERVWVAAGPGNNGGDGLEAALQLRRFGKPVSVTIYGAAQRTPADAALSLQRAQAAGVPIEEPPALQRGDLAIDALLGLGARSIAHTPLAAAVEALNRVACPVLAIDLPSGLAADTGQPLGGPVVNATHTVSLLTLKPGLYTGAGRDHTGVIWFDDLAVDSSAAPPDARLSGGADALQPLPMRRHVQHKGSFGDVVVVGGAHGMLGAALLAARAAHAAGAGRVYLDLLDASLAHDATRPELMFRAGWWKSTPAHLGAATVLAGCGGGSSVREALAPLVAHTRRLVLDADALNAIASDQTLRRQLQGRAPRERLTLLTPHPLEAARLLDTSAAAVQQDRLHAAHELCHRYRCGIVLKGSGSIVCVPGRMPLINPSGDAKLASAGSGDVLAGWIAGYWAQDDEASLEKLVRVVAASVFRHGLAAERASTTPLRAGDLIEAMRGL